MHLFSKYPIDCINLQLEMNFLCPHLNGSKCNLRDIVDVGQAHEVPFPHSFMRLWHKIIEGEDERERNCTHDGDMFVMRLLQQ